MGVKYSQTLEKMSQTFYGNYHGEVVVVVVVAVVVIIIIIAMTITIVNRHTRHTKHPHRVFHTS